MSAPVRLGGAGLDGPRSVVAWSHVTIRLGGAGLDGPRSVVAWSVT